MSSNGHLGTVHPWSVAVFVERYDLPEGTRFEAHAHDRHQIVWTASGAVAVDVGSRTWVLPPTLALWVPAGVEHTTSMTRTGAMRGVWVETASYPGAWSEPVVVAVTPLVRELLEFLSDLALERETRYRAEALLIGLLEPVSAVAITLPMPSDPRVVAVAEGTLDHPEHMRTLDDWGRQVGASVRTLHRLFVAETGLTFSHWRTNARLRLALSCLADGMPASAVARRVGYSSPSAFVAAFRRVTGQTPGAYFRTPATRDPVPAGGG